MGKLSREQVEVFRRVAKSYLQGPRVDEVCDLALSALSPPHERTAEERWIPVSDRLPEEDGRYLTCSNVVGGYDPIVGHYSGDKELAYHWRDRKGNPIYVDAWQTLPPAPKDSHER